MVAFRLVGADIPTQDILEPVRENGLYEDDED